MSTTLAYRFPTDNETLTRELTSLDSLVTLCGYHHRALHQGEFTVDQDLVFRDCGGRELARTFTPASAEDPDYDDAGAATLSVHKLTKGVSHETCSSRWCGEAMDYDMAVSGLLSKNWSG
jgi:hypothetical protein